MAAEYLTPAGVTDWADVRARTSREWTITLLGRYSGSHASNQFRVLQQFFRWHATEDPYEPRADPMANLEPPKVGDKLVPVFTDEELAAMLATCKAGGSRTGGTARSSRCSRTLASGCRNWQA
jgi:site-specific recombinase XerD